MIINKPIEQYTIREIYSNYSEFEKYMKSEAISADKRTDEIKLKIKFVKALYQYREVLQLMPYINKHSDYMIDNILNNIQNIRIEGIDKIEKLNSSEKDNIFYINKEKFEDFDNLMLTFTQIALGNLKTKDDDMEYIALDKARVEYIVCKLKNIRNNREYNSLDYENLDGAKIYQGLVKIFGEKEMLLLSNSNIQVLKEKFNYYNCSLEWFEEDFEEYYKLDKESEYKSSKLDFLKDQIRFLDRNKKLIEDNLANPSKEIMEKINEYKILLDMCKEIPEPLKKQMIENMLRGIKILEDNNEENNNSRGVYFAGEKKVKLYKIDNKNEKNKTMLHEFTHAATTTRDKFGRVVRKGFIRKRR